MPSLFTPLKERGLTTLKLRYDWKTGVSTLFAAKEWDSNQDFSRYNKDFYLESILTNKAVYLNDLEVRALYQEYELSDYLNQVIHLLEQGKHFGMDCYYNEKYDIRFIGNMHSRVRGINNKMHATLSGGIRRHSFDDSELDVIIDGLNLARAMSFKNIAAGISYGGCKTTVHMNPLDLNNMDMMGFLAYTLDSIHCLTGPDMNFPTEMADVMRENFSAYYTGGPNGPIGETGKPTAYGVYLALKEAVKFQHSTKSLDGMTVALQGLGAVGHYMANHLLDEDVKLIVTDIDEKRARKFIADHPNKDITYVKPEEILYVDADIFCPCAVGGIFDDETIPKLKFRMIIGGANNQLKASSQEEEIRLSKLLMNQGILFQEAWWHNTAGVLCGEEEYSHGNQASYERLKKTIEDIVPGKTWDNLNLAKKLNLTPTECAYKTCEDIIYQ